MASMSSSISSLSSSIFSLSSNGSTESSFSGRTHIEAFQESFSDTLIGLCAGRDAKLRIKRRRALKYFQSLPSTPESSFSSAGASTPVECSYKTPALGVNVQALARTACTSPSPPMTRNGRPVLDIAAAIGVPERHPEAPPVVDLWPPSAYPFLDPPYNRSNTCSTQINCAKATLPYESQKCQNAHPIDYTHDADMQARLKRARKGRDMSKAPIVLQRREFREYYQAMSFGLQPIPNQCREYYNTLMFEFRRLSLTPTREAVLSIGYIEQVKTLVRRYGPIKPLTFSKLPPDAYPDAPANRIRWLKEAARRRPQAPSAAKTRAREPLPTVARPVRPANGRPRKGVRSSTSGTRIM